MMHTRSIHIMLICKDQLLTGLIPFTHLPVQLFPLESKVYPSSQLHILLPSTLVHVCSQPPLLVLHSLMSV